MLQADPATQPTVSIVFTNWNTRDMMRDCIRSVKEHTTGVSYDIIVVDDGSTDGSVEMLKTEFPDVMVIVNGENIGVAKSYNRGVAAARGRYIQMLNTDMLFIQNSVRVLLGFLESHPGVAACGGRLRNRDMSSQISIGSFPSFAEALVGALFLKEVFPRAGLPSRGAVVPDDVQEPFEVEYLSGADMLIRKSVVDQIGFFDERFTSYCEETDFCYRVHHQTPLKLYFVPQSEIIHFGGASFKNVREYQIKLMYSSYDKFFRKHHNALYSWVTRFLYAAQYSIRCGVRAALYLVKDGEERKQQVVEALWHARYALFPQERRT